MIISFLNIIKCEGQGWKESGGGGGTKNYLFKPKLWFPSTSSQKWIHDSIKLRRIELTITFLTLIRAFGIICLSWVKSCLEWSTLCVSAIALPMGNSWDWPVAPEESVVRGQ